MDHFIMSVTNTAEILSVVLEFGVISVELGNDQKYNKGGVKYTTTVIHCFI